MHPMFATDYGNGYILLMGLPLLLIAGFVGYDASRKGQHVLARICGAVCVFVALLSGLSLLDATPHTDTALSVCIGVVALVVGIVLMFAKRREV
jgi:uncharacterized membrane protein HdeD (DUF308 family)